MTDSELSTEVSRKSMISSEMVKSMVRSVEEQEALMKSEDEMKHGGLAFDMFEDSFQSQVLHDIELDNFRTLVSRIAHRHAWSDELKERIISTGENGAINDALIEESYDDTQAGKVLYNKLAVAKRSEGKIDLALMYQTLDYQLSPEKVETEPNKWKSFKEMFSQGADQSPTYNTRRDLSEADRVSLEKYLRYRALRGLLQNHPEAAVALPHKVDSSSS